MDGDTLLETAIRELTTQLSPDTNVAGTRHTPRRLPLSTYVEETSKLILEPWQNHMCRRLEKLTHQKGQRVLIHKPPQHGGSIVVSQRLPSYLIGDDPTTRVALAGYNIDHSREFTGVNKVIMQGADYKEMFPEADTRIPTKCSDEKFSTVARRKYNDSQWSLIALGLQTGFVGRGADHLIIDDPYASPQQAASALIRKNVWDFWAKGAKVRIDDNANVIVMFHRYDDDDFVGQLIREEGLQYHGGVWELVSYRAEWDGDERMEVGGPDPMKRKIGEYLSPRKSRQAGYYREMKRNPAVWLSQFQGKPSKEEGNFFSIKSLRVIKKIPMGVTIIKYCRAWDIASTEDGDWTVGVLMGLGDDDYVYIIDVLRFRDNTDLRNKKIRYAAKEDRRKYKNVNIRFAIDPGGAGKDQAVMFRKLLKGFIIIFKHVPNEDKPTRADPYSNYVNAGLVRLVFTGEDVLEKGEDGEYVSWIPPYIEELRVFPGGPNTKKDQVDASADAFSEIALEIDELPGEDFDTVGFSGEDMDMRERNSQGYTLAEILDDNDFIEVDYYGNPEDFDGQTYSYNTKIETARSFKPRTRREKKDVGKAPNKRYRYKRAANG